MLTSFLDLVTESYSGSLAMPAPSTHKEVTMTMHLPCDFVACMMGMLCLSYVKI